MQGGFGSSPLETLAAEAMLRGLVWLDGFDYSATFLTGTTTALPATGSMTIPIQINGDSDFIVQSINLIAFTNATTVLATPNYSLLLTRSGSGRDIMYEEQSVMNICGNLWNNAQPGLRTMPIKLDAANTFNVKLTNNSGVAPNRVQLTFTGFKVFYVNGGTPMNVWNAAAGRASYGGM